MLVGVFQAAGRLLRVVDRLAERQRPFLLDDGRQVPAHDVFHDQVVSSGMLARVVGRDDVGVRQPCRRLHLAIEALNRVGLDCGHGERLQSHHAIHQPVPRPEHDAHPALAEDIQEDILAQDQALGPPLADRRGLVRGQLAALDQQFGNVLDRMRRFRRLQGLLERCNLLDRNQPAFTQVADELLQDENHGHLPAGIF